MGWQPGTVRIIAMADQPSCASREPAPQRHRLSALGEGIRAGLDTDSAYASVVPPVFPSTTFRFARFGDAPEFDYSRSANPTRATLSHALARLEHGVDAVITSSGMAAILLTLDTLVPPGGRVVAAHDCYGGTWRLLTRLAERGRFSLDFVDLTSPDAWQPALARPANLVFLESPSNPLLRLTDIPAVAAAGRAAGALVVADNTLASPVVQQPLLMGCDVVVHSTTKFINGHSDVVGGAVITATRELADQLTSWATTIGVTASPWDCWLTLRGLRTLDARMRVHKANAGVLADELRSASPVTAVHYPGFGALISFELSGGEPAARAFCDGLSCFDLAESLGGTESLVAHPATMTHASMTPQAQAAAGITPGLLRLSVGIEPLDDLLADVRAGLRRAEMPAGSRS